MNEDKARTVRRVFDLARQGHGTSSIASILQEGPEPIPMLMGARVSSKDGGGWSSGSVANILKNKAVTGDLGKGYPEIVASEIFKKVQLLINTSKGGRKGDAVTNLFSGCSYCGVCGASIKIVSGKMRCSKGKANCAARPVDYELVEASILSRFRVQDRDLFAMGRMEIEDATASMQNEIKVRKARIGRLVESVAEGRECLPKAAMGIVQKLEDEVCALEKILKEARDEVCKRRDAIDFARDCSLELKKFKDDPKKREALGKMRLQMQASIKQFVSKIEIMPDGIVQLTFRSGKVRKIDFAPRLL